jgi:hypothetical protein
MRLIGLIVLLPLPLLLAVACDDAPPIAAPDDAFLARAPGMGPANLLQNFVAPHSGDQEVPPVETRARGQATFQLSKDGTELHFQLIAANIENVTQAHIHCGTPDVAGPIVAWLYPASPPAALIPGRFDGVLARGVITEADIVERPDSEECPGGVANLDDLLERMRTGVAYSNVHTTENPPGEVRGHIRAGGPHHH